MTMGTMGRGQHATLGAGSSAAGLPGVSESVEPPVVPKRWGLKAKAVAYIRTSSAANVGIDKDSDKRQRDAITAYAKRAGLEIVGECNEPPSAALITSRPARALPPCSPISPATAPAPSLSRRPAGSRGT